MLKVSRENVNREDIIADKMLRQIVKVKTVKSQCHSKSQKQSHEKISFQELSAVKFSYHDHAPVIFFVIKAMSVLH